MQISWIKLIFQLGLLLLSLARSEVLLHRLDYEISHHPSRNSEVGTVNNLPNNNCQCNSLLNDPIIELFHSAEIACINLERNFWKNVERYCPTITEQYDHFDKSHFQYPMNLRVLVYNLDMIYVTFNIIGDSPNLYGNWWRIYLVDKSYHDHSNGVGFDYDRQDNMIELTGRVIDHWNGTYSVFFAMPIVNLVDGVENNRITYTLDMTLDYLACSGYAEPLFPWKKLHRKVSYQGNFAMRLKLDVYANVTASAPCSTTDNYSTQLSLAQYLSDTGYYASNVWIPSKSTHQCGEDNPHLKLQPDNYLPNIPPTTLKSSVDYNTSKKNMFFLFIGDSTTGQVGRCFGLQKDSCGNQEQCRRSEYSIQLCKKLASSSRYNDVWQALGRDELVLDFMKVDGTHNSSQFIRFLKHRLENEAIGQFGELAIVFNIGLHEMQNAIWSVQKFHLRSLINTLTSGEVRNSLQIPVRIVWRGTWSIHEYCYQRNNYWFRENSILSTYTKAEGVTRLRDPTSWLHHSYVLDALYNTSATSDVKYSNNYWLSKSRVKRYSAENRQNDMRHHDTMVIRASVETTLDSLL